MRKIFDKINHFLKKIKGMGRRTIAITLLIFFSIFGIGVGFAANVGGIADVVEEIFLPNKDADREAALQAEEKAAKEAADNQKSIGMAPETIPADEINDDSKLEAAADMVVIDDEFKQKIKDRPQSKKILRIVQKVTAEKKLSDKQQKKFESYIINNTDITAIYSLYEFLYENFFTEKDMNNAIARYNKGENIEVILQTYFDIEESFVARKYPEGMIEHYIDELNIAINELAVAEILSFRGLIVFDTIIERISNGETMNDICEELGVLNLACDMNSINISQSEIVEYAKKLGISEDKAAKKIISAKKAKVDDKDVLDHIKSNDTEGKKLKKHYTEKFETEAAR